MADGSSSALGKRVWDDAFDQLRQTMQAVFDQIVYFGINRINVSNPVVKKSDIIDRLTPLEDKADVRLLKEKLSYLSALETSNKINIIRHEIPLLATYLIGVYINDMKKDNNTVLVDGVESGIQFLLWWFKQKTFSPEVIDDAFKMLGDTIAIFDEFQAFHSYSEFNDNMQIVLYSEYIKDLESLKQVSFTGMATRFIPITLTAMQKKMQLHAVTLLCLDAVIPTLFEIFGNASRFSTRYRLFAYIDLLIATAILAVTVPDGAYDLKEVAVNAILLFPVVLKAEFAYRLLEGRGFPHVTEFLPRTTYTVAESVQMWAMSYDPMAIEFWKFVKVGVGLITTGLVTYITADVIFSVFKEFASVFRDARKARGVMLFTLSTATGLAIAYETLTAPKLTDMIYAFDIKEPFLNKTAQEFVEMIGGTYANLAMVTRAFVANHGNMSMHFDHSGMPFNWGSMSRYKKKETDETGSDKYAWMVPVSTKMTSVLNIMLLGMSMFGKAAILNAALPDIQLISVRSDPINLMQQLVNELGYVSFDTKHYTYNISGLDITISKDTFDTGLNVETSSELKKYQTAIDMFKTIWQTGKTQKVDDKLLKATWDESIAALNYLNKVPIIEPIVPRFIEVLNETKTKQIIQKVDIESARIELNTNLALLYEKYGLLDKWAFLPVVLNQKYNPFQLQCLNQEVLRLRDSIILNALEGYTMMVDYANSKEYDIWTIWKVRGAITVSLIILYTLGIHRVIAKAIENALKPSSKPDLNQSRMTVAARGVQNWGYQFFPVVISAHITFEMFYITTGFADETRLEFWKGFWGVKTVFGGNTAYNNGAFYRKNWDLLIMDTAFNLNYFLPRQLSTRMIIDGVYIQRPQTQLKTKSR